MLHVTVHVFPAVREPRYQAWYQGCGRSETWGLDALNVSAVALQKAADPSAVLPYVVTACARAYKAPRRKPQGAAVVPDETLPLFDVTG